MGLGFSVSHGVFLLLRFGLSKVSRLQVAAFGGWPNIGGEDGAHTSRANGIGIAAAEQTPT